MFCSPEEAPVRFCVGFEKVLPYRVREMGNLYCGCKPRNSYPGSIYALVKVKLMIMPLDLNIFSFFLSGLLGQSVLLVVAYTIFYVAEKWKTKIAKA